MCGGTPTVKISISASSKTPFPPTLNDGSHSSTTEQGDVDFVTLVSAGSNIQFTVGGDISAITAITYTGENNVFKTMPTKQSDGSWQGVIGDFAADTEESYSITYTVNGAPNNPYTQDPKIRINK